ncbi:hypothetical protein DRQ36_05265 [bacterium]|nr:MAG: hypothetical protein DRQ36_05265 [bacterium]
MAIDSDGFVWVLTGGPSSWKATVWKSDSAYASDLNFTSVGCPSTGSCQGVTMCIDKDNNVHCSYYDNSSSTGYAVHRYYNGSSWEMRDDMGDGSTGGRDHNCGMAADDLGNVHILYANNAGDVTGIWYFKYRKWDSVSGISDPVDLCSFPTSLYSDVCNRYISNICCNESTGDAFVIIRDLNEGGSLCLYRKTLTDTAFTLIEEITADTMGVHYYYEPRMRGTLFPAFNNTSITIDISWTEDRSGSSHEPFYRYTLSEGPYLMSTFPPPNLWVSVDTAIVLVFLDPDGIDPSTARIAVNGISYTTFDHELTCSGDSVIFQPSSPWPEDTITVELIGIDDALGHASPDSGLTYSFFIDKSPPVITYREPDSALVMDYIPSGTMIKYKDFGCGTDSLRWVLTVAGEDFSAPSGGGLIIEGDTTVMLAFSIAGIVISDGDTVDMEFTIRDNPDIGAPNLRNYYWWFTASTGIEERKFPLESCLSIYPNPFNRACRIYSANPVKIYDISGHLVWRSDEMKKDCPASSQGHEYIWIPDESLQSGVFLVKMQIDGKYLAKKVIYLK